MAATSSFGALPKVRESIGAISPLQDLSPCRVYLSTLAPQYCAGFSKSWDCEDGPAPSHCPGGRTCVCGGGRAGRYMKQDGRRMIIVK